MTCELGSRTGQKRRSEGARFKIWHCFRCKCDAALRVKLAGGRPLTKTLHGHFILSQPKAPTSMSRSCTGSAVQTNLTPHLHIPMLLLRRCNLPFLSIYFYGAAVRYSRGAEGLMLLSIRRPLSCSSQGLISTQIQVPLSLERSYSHPWIWIWLQTISPGNFTTLFFLP